MATPLCYKKMLARELNFRRKKNKKYSQNAFAHQLEVSTGYLSQVINGKRNLTEKRAYSLIPNLNWNEKDSELFVQLVKLSNSREDNQREEIAKQIKTIVGDDTQFRSIKEDTFRLISEWHHAAILELTKIRNFKFDPDWIAKILKIDRNEASSALTLLNKLNFLEKTKNTYRTASGNIKVGDIPSAAIRQFHKQHLKKALDCLAHAASPDRNISGITIAADSSRIAQANRKIDRFRTEIMEFLDGGKENDAVFHLTVSMIRLTEKAEK